MCSDVHFYIVRFGVVNKDDVLGLKQIIKQQKILASGAVDGELVLPGEPLIYSIKYQIGERRRSVQFFRNEKWKSLLKCYFRSYYHTSIPVVVLVRFYVSPPSHVNVKHRDLVKETVPAVHSFELCDYILSFIEMLHHVLINSYRQIVKFDVEKYYSDEPRTVFKFMKWEHYVDLQNNYTVHPESKRKRKDGEVWLLQPKLKRNVQDPGVCQETARDNEATPVSGTLTCCSALPITCTVKRARKKASSTTPQTAHKET